MATVLVVDDNRDIRSILRRILEEAAHRVLQAGHGRDALRIVNECELDLIILDIVMPEMDGLETIMELKRKQCRVPIIAMSAVYADIAKSLGADEVLGKPFTPEEVTMVVNKVMDWVK